MASIFQTLKSAAVKRAKYNRTVAELQNLPLDVALDLDIYRGDIPEIARKAVYGA